MLYMMIRPEVADEFNKSLMYLLMPEHLRDNYTTIYYCGKIIHPTNGYAALVMPENETVPIHIESSGDELDDLLNLFVSDNALTQEEADVISQQVIDSKGQSISILDLVPDSWKPFVLTYEQADAAGWFPAEEEESTEEDNTPRR